MDEEAYKNLQNALKEMKRIEESRFDKTKIGEEIEINYFGRKRKEIFAGFKEWYPGCRQEYKKIPTTIYEDEKGKIFERKILDYNTLMQDPGIISERPGSELKRIDSSSDLAKQYRSLLEAKK